VEDEQSIGLIPVNFTEAAAAFDQTGVITVAVAPGGPGDAVHFVVSSPATDPFQQWSSFSGVVMQGQGQSQSVGSPVHW